MRRDKNDGYVNPVQHLGPDYGSRTSTTTIPLLTRCAQTSLIRRYVNTFQRNIQRPHRSCPMLKRACFLSPILAASPANASADLRGQLESCAMPESRRSLAQKCQHKRQTRQRKDETMRSACVCL